MAKKNSRATRAKIVSAAWKLFYEQGYEDTTVEEIIEVSQTSKGSFYHYFDGKDALLSTLSSLFDEKYEELWPGIPVEMDSLEKLAYLTRELFGFIEDTVSLELLARLRAHRQARGDGRRREPHAGPRQQRLRRSGPPRRIRLSARLHPRRKPRPAPPVHGDGDQ